MRTFAAWTKENMQALRAEPGDVAADRIGDAVLEVDLRLGVEIANEEEGQPRELIVTAFSNAELFPLVRQIVQRMSSIPGWQIVPLKPPRGFEFTITLGPYSIQAQKLSFAFIPGMHKGIRLIAAAEVVQAMRDRNAAEELAWLTVETGIGEELTGTLEHVEFAVAESDQQTHLISELRSYLSGIHESGNSDS